MLLLKGFWFEVLLYTVLIEIALLLAVRLFFELIALIKTRPTKLPTILTQLTSDSLATGQYMPETGEPYSNDERIWAREQGAKTDSQETELLRKTEGA